MRRGSQEYQQACQPYAYQEADGELAAMDIGASLWAVANQTREGGAAITQAVKAGTMLFSKGDRGTSLFAVCSGQVKISVPSLDGRDAVFNVVNAGEIFGEIALFDGGPRTASATAMTECELMLIERRDFVPLLMRHPELALRAATERFRARVEGAAELAGRDGEDWDALDPERQLGYYARARLGESQ